MDRETRTVGLTLVACFKWLKGVALIAAGLAALKLAHGQWLGALLWVSRHFNLTPGRRLLDSVIDRVLNESAGKLDAVGVGSFLYAALFLVEGTGLWLVRRWAEYLTVVSTSTFIPFEVAELLHSPTPLTWAGLALNIVVVIYLALRLRHHRGEPARARRVHFAAGRRTVPETGRSP